MSICIAHRRRKTSNALDTLVLSEQECSMNVGKTRHYTSDRGGQPTANSKSSVKVKEVDLCSATLGASRLQYAQVSIRVSPANNTIPTST